MSRLKYDIIGVVTNDLVTDQRMQRIFSYFSKNGHRALLLGHQKSQSAPLTNQSFDQKRIKTIFQSGPLFYLEFNLRILALLFTFKTRRLYAVDLDSLLAVGLAGKIKHTPYIYDAHELFTKVPELAGAPIKKRTWELVGRLFIKGANTRLTVGEAVKEALSKKYGSEFLVVPNYPEFKEILAQNKTREKIILYQGRVNKGRGIKEMIEAMDLIIEEVQLWICGTGDLYDELKEMASISQSKERILFLGEIKPTELYHITQKAWLGLNLLDNGSQNYYLSAANKVYDYIMAGIPFLTMDFPEYRMLNERYECGILIENLSALEISAQINQLYTNHERYQIKAHHCMNARHDLKWTNVVRRLDSLI